ncbi:hypothetical protein Q7P35_006794 [Cladosporium inversicolor]
MTTTQFVTQIKVQEPSIMRHKLADTVTASTMRVNSIFTVMNLRGFNYRWRIPRRAAGQYAGYADVLQKLEGCLLQPQSEDEQVVCVLSGMGGVGKSESVLQFLKRHDSALRKRFWAVIRYIPNSARDSAVLTTWLSDADKYASLDTQVMTPKLFVQMDGLDPASATQLILDASKIQEQGDETVQHAQRIADALDYHPLAIVVACSLIRSNVYSISKYAEALKDRLT